VLKLCVCCVTVSDSGLMAEVDYVILDEWYKWIVDSHPCHVNQIGLCLSHIHHENVVKH